MGKVSAADCFLWVFIFSRKPEPTAPLLELSRIAGLSDPRELISIGFRLLSSLIFFFLPCFAGEGVRGGICGGLNFLGVELLLFTPSLSSPIS